MSSFISRQVMETRLCGFPELLPVAWPNMSFLPQDGAYLEVQYSGQSSVNAAFSSHAHARETETMQINVYWPAGGGAGPLLQYARRLQDWFPAGWGEVKEGEQVRVTKRPFVSSAIPAGAWFCVAVQVNFSNYQL
ncbi:phage tail terminator-like protein [Pseudescherichia vulneris]